MKVGLVLGAGGIVGASWLIGSLQALSETTGFEAHDAEFIVGTSAGSVIGSLAAAGHEAAQMSAVVRSEIDEVQAVGEMAAQAREVAGVDPRHASGTSYRLALAPPPIGPGSWRLVLNTLRHPGRHSPGTVLGGWLPRGFIRTTPISELVERFVAEPWPEHPNFWAVACDYSSGRRTAFGREDAPPAFVGDAVAASCAIPGFYHPVRIGGRRYVDGGVCSPSNLDLLADYGLDLVVCLNPMSSLAHVPARGPAGVVGSLVRQGTGRRLGREARKLREGGTDVLLLQPTAADLELMGLNFMSSARRVQIMERARQTTARELLARREQGASLPGRRRRRSATASRRALVA